VSSSQAICRSAGDEDHRYEQRVAEVRLEDEAADHRGHRQANQVATSDRPCQQTERQERQEDRGRVPGLDEHGAAERPAQRCRHGHRGQGDEGGVADRHPAVDHGAHRGHDQRKQRNRQ
jgi:hypothetical protein